MQAEYGTARLLLKPLSITDAKFIYELVNTPAWKKFIGERNVHSIAEAESYIRNILSNSSISYWVVSAVDGHTAYGVVTLIKRDYLEHHDIGFAFLPKFTRQGYAYEASRVLLDDLLRLPQHPRILATTLLANISSIQLLSKLGFNFVEEISQGNDRLQLYEISVSKNEI